MKNKVKLIVNPFIRIAGGQALIWGFLGLIVITMIENSVTIRSL